MESTLADQSSASRSPVLAPGRIHAHAHVFMPQPDEPVHAYAARLRAMHHHLGMLIEAVERGMSGRPSAPAVKRERPADPPPLTPLVVVATPPMRAPSRPAPAPAREPVLPAPFDPAVDRERRRGGPDRRQGVRDRRSGPDRRRGGPDRRAVREERRAGPADRRSGRRDRRLGHARRAVDRRPTQLPEPHLDTVTFIWVVNVAVWLGIFAFAMVWAS
jgi:hypothetical protein